MLSCFADWLSVPDEDCAYIMWNDANQDSRITCIQQKSIGYILSHVMLP